MGHISWCRMGDEWQPKKSKVMLAVLAVNATEKASFTCSTLLTRQSVTSSKSRSVIWVMKCLKGD